MVIDGYSNDMGKSLAKIHRHAYTFIRAPSPDTSSQKASFLSGHIAKGDPVSLSIEPDLFALSRGYVLDLTPTSVTIGVQQVIDPSALLKRTTWRHATRQLAQLSLEGDDTVANEHEETGRVVFRIDKDEMSGGVARMRNNLAQLFLPGGNDKLRRIVVDHTPPRFSSHGGGSAGQDAFDVFASQGPLASLPDVPAPESFNADQRQAMQKVLSAQDYALILGMPGTGKTTTIAEIIKAIVARGQTVLLTSYTHSAVDTILRKLVNEDIGMLRLGNVDKVS
jgi:DNA replication ATP-dependent helicase Dna2